LIKREIFQEKMTEVKNGDIVKVHYTGTFDDGTLFDSSENREPIQFQVGAGQIIKGFNDAVLGMKLNEEKNIHLTPAEAYGEPNPQLLRRISQSQLPKDREPQVGMNLGLVRGDGMQTEGRIIEVTKEDIAIDLNHPLSGKNLNFTLKLVSIN